MASGYTLPEVDAKRNVTLKIRDADLGKQVRVSSNNPREKIGGS